MRVKLLLGFCVGASAFLGACSNELSLPGKSKEEEEGKQKTVELEGEEPEIRKVKKKQRKVEIEELGDIPKAFAGELTEVTPLVGVGDQPEKINLPADISVESANGKCKTKKAVEALLVGKAKIGGEDSILVQVPDAADLTCDEGANATAGNLFEGYVKKSDLNTEAQTVVQTAVDTAATGNPANGAPDDTVEVADDVLYPEEGTPAVDEGVVTTETKGCTDVTQVFLERDAQDFGNNPEPKYWKKFSARKIDPDDGCLNHKKSHVLKKIEKLEKLLAKTNKDAKKKRIEKRIAELKEKLAKSGDGIICIVPGAFIRRAGQSPKGDYALMIEGGGPAIDKIRVTTKFDTKRIDNGLIKKNPDCKRADNDTIVGTVSAADSFDKDSGQYIVTFEEFLRCNPYMGANVAMTIELLGKGETAEKEGAVVPNACEHKFREMSPLVLDMSGAPMVKTITPAESKVRFDLNADGTKLKTGWVGGDVGLLALDRDGNGKIDDGRELFGERTPQGEVYAENGFAALAAFDEKKKGFVDQSDAVFTSLRLWLDANQDGVSQPGELRSMADHGITRLDTRYELVAEDLRRQGGQFGNDVRYKSKFYGPKQCGTQGCGLYDVYFGTQDTKILGSR